MGRHLPKPHVQKWILKPIHRKACTFSSHELFEPAEVHDVRLLDSYPAFYPKK